MRIETTVKLAPKRVAIVRELRLKDVRRLVAEFKELSDLQLTDLFNEQFDRLIALAGDMVEMPAGETAEDLTLSEAEQIFEAMKEVNASFLQKIGLNLALTSEALPQSGQSGNLTETPAE